MTPRQAKGLEFIRGYIETKGHAPSYREMAEGMGYTSTAPVHALVRRLQDRGHIRLTPRQFRSVEVLTPAGPSEIIKGLCEAVERLLHQRPSAGLVRVEDQVFAINVLVRARKLCQR